MGLVGPGPKGKWAEIDPKMKSGQHRPKKENLHSTRLGCPARGKNWHS
jgi:hypothetical protein